MKNTSTIIDAALSAAREARAALESVDQRIADARRERARVVEAPIGKEDFVACMAARVAHSGKAFEDAMVRFFGRAQISYAMALKAGSVGDGFPFHPMAPGPSQLPELSPGSFAFFFGETIMDGVRRYADKVTWSDGAVPLAARPAQIAQLEALITDLVAEREALAEALGSVPSPAPE